MQVASFWLEIREEWSLLLSGNMSLNIARDKTMKVAFSELSNYQDFDANSNNNNFRQFAHLRFLNFQRKSWWEKSSL